MGVVQQEEGDGRCNKVQRVGDRGESPTWPDPTVRDLSDFGRSSSSVQTGPPGVGTALSGGRDLGL